MPTSQSVRIITVVRLSADYIVTLSIYHGWQLRFIQYSPSTPPDFAALAIQPVSAQEGLPVVDSSKSSLNDLQKPGQVSPSAHAQPSKPGSPIPGMTSLVPPSSFFGGVGIGGCDNCFRWTVRL
jgi:hypothetical protein